MPSVWAAVWSIHCSTPGMYTSLTNNINSRVIPHMVSTDLMRGVAETTVEETLFAAARDSMSVALRVMEWSDNR